MVSREGYPLRSPSGADRFVHHVHQVFFTSLTGQELQPTLQVPRIRWRSFRGGCHRPEFRHGELQGISENFTDVLGARQPYPHVQE